MDAGTLLAMLGFNQQIDPALRKQIYEDFAQPSVQEAGKTMGQIVHGLGLLAVPFILMGSYRERLQKMMERVADAVPEERRIPASANVVGPILEKLRFVEEGSVFEEMFFNVLTAAVDRDRQLDAHPSFGTIIGSLAQDEAFFLFDLAQKSPLSVEVHGELMEPREPDAMFAKMGVTKFPPEPMALVVKDRVPEAATFPTETLNSYLDHLASLGVIEKDEFNQMTMTDEVKIVRVGLTSFGVHFAGVALPSAERVAEARSKSKTPK